MVITLWQLNESYHALVRLASQEFPKNQHKLAYQLSRTLKSAKAEIEQLAESVNSLLSKCESQEDYNEQFKRFTKETTCDVWGNPISLKDLEHVSISPLDLANLDWLIVEEISTVEEAQAATV